MAVTISLGARSGLPPLHPGELLREEVLPALGRSKVEIAALLRISRQQLYDILEARKPVSPQMALRLGKLCGNGPDLWLALQSRWDLVEAEAAIAEELAQIPTLEAADAA